MPNKDGTSSALRLTTLAAAQDHPLALTSVRRTLFASGEIALMPEDLTVHGVGTITKHAKTYTAVAVDGKNLSSEEAHDSQRLRRTVHTARGLQLLLAMKAAVAQKWVRDGRS